MIPADLKRETFPLVLKPCSQVTLASFFKVRERRIVILALGSLQSTHTERAKNLCRHGWMRLGKGLRHWFRRVMTQTLPVRDRSCPPGGPLTVRPPSTFTNKSMSEAKSPRSAAFIAFSCQPVPIALRNVAHELIVSKRTGALLELRPGGFQRFLPAPEFLQQSAQLLGKIAFGFASEGVLCFQRDAALNPPQSIAELAPGLKHRGHGRAIGGRKSCPFGNGKIFIDAVLLDID